MGIWQRIRERAERGDEIGVAVVGAGFIGKGLVHRLARTPGMAPTLVVNRTPERAADVLRQALPEAREPVVSDDQDALKRALNEGLPAVATSPEVIGELDQVDVVVEATGAMEFGARTIIGALEAGKHVVSMNAELDATIGHLLESLAERAEAIYTIADGDQPGVLLRQMEFVTGMGFDVVAAANCKRNLDVHQNPTDSEAYAARDSTSLLMTTAFGDGTKMQIENAVVANLSGLVPDRRGMHGVSTTLEHAVADVTAALSRRGVVEFTLGGDFGGGVFVIGRASEPDMDAPYMRYSKMGPGPDYLFFRPYHLLHFEVPRTIAEVVLDRQRLGSRTPEPVAEVIAIAKRDLESGRALDGIGGYDCYGHIDTAEGASGLLPIGLAEAATVTRPVRQDDPVPLDAVELDPAAPMVELRGRQAELIGEVGWNG